MSGHQQDTPDGNIPSHLETNHHITLLAGSRAGKGRSIIIIDLLGGDRRIDQNRGNPKPMDGASDPAR